MTWMNAGDVRDTADFWKPGATSCPNTFRASQVLLALMQWTNSCSDGWHSWPKPGRAASKLTEALEQQFRDYREDGHAYRNVGTDGNYERGELVEFTDLTDKQLMAALTPIRSFLTREKVDDDIKVRILAAGIPKPPTLDEHIASICREAGLGVMVQIYQVVADRERDGVEEYLRGLDADDVEAHYNQFVGPAIDNIEDEI